MQQITEKSIKKPRFSISVSSGTYDRLRAAVAPGNLAGLVDDIITSTLDDPEILAGLLGRCRQGRAPS